MRAACAAIRRETGSDRTEHVMRASLLPRQTGEMDDQDALSRGLAAAEHTLVLLRHAKSDWSGHEPDLERPLAKRGTRQALVAGKWLHASIDALDLVILSPAVRVRRTWDLVAAELESSASVRVDDRIYGASAAELLAVVRTLPENAQTALMVGHNPGLEDLVPRLTGTKIAMKTSGIAVIRLSGGWAAAGHSAATLLVTGRPPDPATARDPAT